jgi:hypothetical protein
MLPKIAYTTEWQAVLASWRKPKSSNVRNVNMKFWRRGRSVLYADHQYLSAMFGTSKSCSVVFSLCDARPTWDSATEHVTMRFHQQFAMYNPELVVVESISFKHEIKTSQNKRCIPTRAGSEFVRVQESSPYSCEKGIQPRAHPCTTALQRHCDTKPMLS